MRKVTKGHLLRPRSTPQWGWSGVHLRQAARMPTRRLRETVRKLPSRKSSIEGLVAELRECGVVFLGDLTQDEYGPTRAERAAALRILIETIEQVSAAIDALTFAERRYVVDALTPAPEAVVKSFPIDSFDEYEAENQNLEALALAAADASGFFRSRWSSAEIVAIDHLRALSERAAAQLQSLDTTTEIDLILGSAAMDKMRSAEERKDPLAREGESICVLSSRLRKELGRLSRLKGPDLRTSLPLLVARLCDFWKRETGQDVTVNPYEKTAYKGAPQSESGAFVSNVVEALAPKPTELGAMMRESGRKSAPHLKSRRHWSPEAVHSAMRLYVKAETGSQSNRTETAEVRASAPVID